MSRAARAIRVINHGFHLDLIEKSVRSKYRSISVQPPVRKSRKTNGRWPELVYRLGLLRKAFILVLIDKFDKSFSIIG